MNYTLGTIEATNQLLTDLYIRLKSDVNKWSLITNQTPQARMGYIGQHLVSVVTGFPGGKSGARGYDLVISDNEYGEIKTCYRVDQLGKCNICGNSVSSLEIKCSNTNCNSTDINRNDDSKWLISIRNDNELSKISEPLFYYFVLFEFDNINDKNNNDIITSIWKVNPKLPGFELCMLDYYYNIRANSNSKAAFNMWPHMLKFHLTRPTLIYSSIIRENNTIDTLIFENDLNYINETPLLPLSEYSRSTNLTIPVLDRLCENLNIEVAEKYKKNKRLYLNELENIRLSKNISNSILSDELSKALYTDKLTQHYNLIPINLRNFI